MKILVIGGGNMGMTYAQGFLRSHITTKEDMMILEKSPQKASMLSKKDIGTVYGDPAECLGRADLIILAVKPQDSEELFSSLRPHINKEQVIVSIMAGVKIKTIQDQLTLQKVIRAMPNLPAQIGMGMTALTASEEVTRIELLTVQNLINTTGKSVYVETEDHIDGATAISGSGPAYVFYFMQSMMESAQKLGFSESESELLVSQTFKGAVDLFNKSELNAKEWINKVASKGGTTEAALSSFATSNLAEEIKKGTVSAYDRAIELGTNY